MCAKFKSVNKNLESSRQKFTREEKKNRKNHHLPQTSSCFAESMSESIIAKENTTPTHTNLGNSDDGHGADKKL
jgi:hypothetical protein